MTYTYLVDGQEHVVNLEVIGERYHVIVDGTTYNVAAQSGPEGAVNLEIDGRRVCAFVASDAATSGAKAGDAVTRVWIDGESWDLAHGSDSTSRRRRQMKETASSGSVTASMPGQVLEVHVAVGDSVDVGDALLVLEAMKMQSRLTASHAGRVAVVNCTAGDIVTRGQLLVEIE